MLVLSKDRILKDYFIDQNAVITDKNGNIQEQTLSCGRYYFKGILVHKIMMYTFLGIKSGDYVIHHADWNPKNNKLGNLVYLTRAEHTKLHKKGKHWQLSDVTKAKMRVAKKGKKLSEEHKHKLSAAHKGKKLSTETKAKVRAARLGKQLSTETKAKLSATNKGTKYFNDGTKNIRCKPEECPDGFVPEKCKKL